MSTKEAIKRAQKKYDTERTKSIHLKLHRELDADLIEALERHGNKNGLVKEALRLYLGRREKE